MELLDKDKLLLVYYVNVKHMDKQRALASMARVNSYLIEHYDDSVKWLVVPSDKNAVEWINKYDISEEQFDKLQQIENNLNNILNEIN